MALRANQITQEPDRLAALESNYGYRLVAPNELAMFLDDHRELFTPLVKASSAIREFFPNQTGVDLELSKDYDSNDPIGDGMLIVTIRLSALSIDEQLSLLDTFNRQWRKGSGKSLSAVDHNIVFNIQAYA
jgi:hypothetical protein